MPTATKTPRSSLTYRRPWLADYQLEAIFAPERYAVIEATTKAGKTVGCMVWISEQAMRGKAGQNYWWIAPIYSQAKIAYRRLKRALPLEVYTANESELTITLANGAVIWFKGADNPDSLYGEDVYAAVIDEATRCKEEAWYAIRSTLTATRGPIRIIGNVKGRKNWAYNMARRAESGDATMHYAKITALDAIRAGIISEAEVEDAKRQLPEAVFRELYLAEPSDDEGNPFGLTAIRACVAPLSKAEPVAWGWDLAKSTDWTVGIALDSERNVCRFERWQGPWEMTIQRIHALTGGGYSLIDSTGVGDPILEALQHLGGGYEGFKFSQASKQQLMEGLAVAIQQRQLRYPDGPIANELESFEYVYSRTGVSYSAPVGLHDDCVIGLGLAWMAAKGTGPIFAWGGEDND